MIKRYVRYSLLLVTLLLAISCKEDTEEREKHDMWDKETYYIDSLVGYFTYDDDLSKWVIYPSRNHENPFTPRLGNGDGATIIVENSSLIDEDLKDKEVLVSGNYKGLYYEYSPHDPLSGQTYYYSMSIDMIQPYNESRTRTAINSEKFETLCMTYSPLKIASWYTVPIYSPYTVDYSKCFDFRVYLHVIRKSDGTSAMPIPKETIASDLISTLNNYYSETGIAFTLYGSEDLNNNAYYNLPYSNLTNIFQVNSHSNAIDIYVFANPNNFYHDNKILLGKAEDFFSTACLINTSYYNTSTVAHEIGHCIGLYHTHHGTYHEDNDGIPEYVDHSNSYNAGDYIYDTPADPNCWYYGQYDGNNQTPILTDGHGEPYNPDPTNIMSYSFSQNNFSRHQIAMMHRCINKMFPLISAATIVRKEISGPDFINTSGTYSIDCPAGSTVVWNITCYTYGASSLTPISTTSQTIYGTTITLTNSQPSSLAQKYILDATITTPKGYVKKISKTVHHVIINSSTGCVPYSTELGIGELSFNSYTDINIYPGGTLYLNYTEPSGSDAVLYPDDYYFNINDGGYNLFTKDPGSNRVFYLNNSAGIGTINGIVQVGVTGGGMALLPVRFRIQQHSNTMSNDSISILKEEYEENL